MAAKKKNPGKTAAKAKAKMKSGAKTKSKSKAKTKAKVAAKTAVKAKAGKAGKSTVKAAAKAKPKTGTTGKAKPAGKPAAPKKSRAAVSTKSKVAAKPMAKAVVKAKAPKKKTASVKAVSGKAASGSAGQGAVKVLTIRQTAMFPAEPAVVYDLIMDEAKHAAFTGAPASISREKLGTFSAHGGYCTGVQMELIDGERIVQTWRGSDWPEGHFSIATFEFEAVPGGTNLTFTQVGVPENHFAGIESGWNEHYWQPMKEMLESA